MPMISTILLIVTLGTIMLDQLSFFRNQPFTEARDPPSIPAIIKLNIEPSNPVVPDSLAYQETDGGASEIKQGKVGDLCDATQDAGLTVSDTPHQESGALNSTRKINQHGSHGPPPVWDVIIGKDRGGQVRQAEFRQNMKHSTLCNSARGKNPEVLPRPLNMEVPSSGPALERLTEFLAAITLATSGAVLALAIIAITCWALNSRWLRAYLLDLCTDQLSNRPNVTPSVHFTVSIYEDPEDSQSEGSVTMSEGGSQVSNTPAEQNQDMTSSQ